MVKSYRRRDTNRVLSPPKKVLRAKRIDRPTTRPCREMHLSARDEQPSGTIPQKCRRLFTSERSQSLLCVSVAINPLSRQPRRRVRDNHRSPASRGNQDNRGNLDSLARSRSLVSRVDPRNNRARPSRFAMPMAWFQEVSKTRTTPASTSPTAAVSKTVWSCCGRASFRAISPTKINRWRHRCNST